MEWKSADIDSKAGWPFIQNHLQIFSWKNIVTLNAGVFQHLSQYPWGSIGGQPEPQQCYSPGWSMHPELQYLSQRQEPRAAGLHHLHVLANVAKSFGQFFFQHPVPG